MCQDCDDFYERRAREYMGLATEIQRIVMIQINEGIDDKNTRSLFIGTNITERLQDIQNSLQIDALGLLKGMRKSTQKSELASEFADECLRCTEELIETVMESDEGGFIRGFLDAIQGKSPDPEVKGEPFDPRMN